MYVYVYICLNAYMSLYTCTYIYMHVCIQVLGFSFRFAKTMSKSGVWTLARRINSFVNYQS